MLIFNTEETSAPIWRMGLDCTIFFQKDLIDFGKTEAQSAISNW